jgi:hypothetical protein
VVVDIYAYAGDGRSDVGDATAGTKVAQLSANCSDHAAFARPIDVTHIVRQTTTASGIRFVGFNVRKANNRQGPGLFSLSAGKLTVVIADQDIERRQMGRPGMSPGGTAVAAAPHPAATPAPTPMPRKSTAPAAPTGMRNQAQR